MRVEAFVFIVVFLFMVLVVGILGKPTFYYLPLALLCQWTVRSVLMPFSLWN
jgi:hypothetical protein